MENIGATLSAMSSFRSEIEKAVLEKLSHMPFEQVLELLDGPAKRPVGRPPGPAKTPRQETRMEEVLDAVLMALKGKREGLRSEQLQNQTGFDKADIAKAMNQALEQNLVHKEGERRATRYISNLVEAKVEEEEAPRSRAAAKHSQVEMPIPAPPKGHAPTVIRRKKAGK